MTAEAIHAFFHDYVRAFAREDVQAVVDCWRFPALIATPAGNFLLDEPAFRRNTAALCSFYRRQGMAEARKTVADIHSLSPAVAGVTTDDALYDGAGNLIAAWRHGYVLREADGTIHAIAAIADSEVEAWAARGTPLGVGLEGSVG